MSNETITEEQATETGKIVRIYARGSIGFLVFEGGKSVQIETNSTLRAFESAFGSVEAALGKEIEYATGSDGWDSNLLAWFVPTESEG